jgi:Protein of unknown function (DUF1194)
VRYFVPYCGGGTGAGESVMPKWLRTVFVLLIVSVLTVWGSSGARADEGEVDVLLVLAADVSRSVDDKKFKLQREGYAAAIVDPRVVRAMTGGPKGRIGVVFVEWASEWEQKVVIDWTIIASEQDARQLSGLMLGSARSFWGRTSISAAIDFSSQVLSRSPFLSSRRVIDISGDGTNNSGREVTAARDAAIAQGVTINGLVILSDVPLPTNPTHTNPPGGLTAYYENNVIGGPGAFVLEAESFQTFGQLLVNKLVKEIARLAQTPT